MYENVGTTLETEVAASFSVMIGGAASSGLMQGA